MSAGHTRPWSPRKFPTRSTVPHEDVLERTNAPILCRVCKLSVAGGAKIWHQAWSSQVAHLECGWLTDEERSVLERVAAGEHVMLSSARADMKHAGFLREKMTKERRGVYRALLEVTDAGRRMLAVEGP